MRTAHTTADVIERLAYHTHLQIELTKDAAFLTVGDITWIAPLPEAVTWADSPAVSPSAEFEHFGWDS